MVERPRGAPAASSLWPGARDGACRNPSSVTHYFLSSIALCCRSSTMARDGLVWLLCGSILLSLVNTLPWLYGIGQTETIAEICRAPPAPETNTDHVTIEQDVPQLVQPSVPCGSLRWQPPPLSSLAGRLRDHQQNESLPVRALILDDSFGLGSHLHLWSQALCLGYRDGYRIRTVNEDWLWSDGVACQGITGLDCYFPGAEPAFVTSEETLPDPRVAQCSIDGVSLFDWRASTMEYLFGYLSPLVLQEARRQRGFIESATLNVAVHVRWGDKFWEMDLPNMTEYVEAVQSLVQGEANVYLSTEDPKAADEFRQRADNSWTVHVDRTLVELGSFRPKKGNRASWTARNTQGRAGLVALGSLIVALEADAMVVTTQSNWSRLWNYLRTRAVDQQCGNCTQVVDLRPGQW